MVKRFQEIAAYFNLSPTAFADRIEVARPIISHIFSERNKPSLEVIQKIGMAFPEIDLNWLLYGHGEMLKKIAGSEKMPAAGFEIPQTDLEGNKEYLDKINTNQAASIPSLNNFDSGIRKIKKVLVFYEDNTFEEFSPGIRN